MKKFNLPTAVIGQMRGRELQSGLSSNLALKKIKKEIKYESSKNHLL